MEVAMAPKAAHHLAIVRSCNAINGGAIVPQGELQLHLLSAENSLLAKFFSPDQIKSSTWHWVGLEKIAVGKQPPILEIKFYWLLSFHWSLNGQLLPNNGTHFFSLPRLNYFRLRFNCIWVPFFAHLNCVRLPRRAKQWEVEIDRRLRLTPSNATNDFSSSSSPSALRSSLSMEKESAPSFWQFFQFCHAFCCLQ